MRRFKVEEGSHSGHCCFEFTVVDTSKPHLINDKPCGFETVCECFEEDEAKMIVKALNANHNP